MKQRRTYFFGVALMFAGAILFSAKAIMVKISYRYGVDSSALLALRMLFSLPFFAAAAWFTNKSRPQAHITKVEWGQVLFLGIMGYYLASIFDFEGLKHVSANIERLILFVYPTLVVVISAIFFKRPLRKMELLALLLTYGGIGVVYLHDMRGHSSSILLGAFFVFLSALTYATYIVGSGKLIPKFGSVNYTAWAMIVSTFATLIHNYLLSNQDLLALPHEVYWLTLAMAIFSTVIPGFMVSEAIRIIGSSRASIVASIGPVSTIILANIFLGEVFTLYQFIGTVMVLGGVLLVSTQKGEK